MKKNRISKNVLTHVGEENKLNSEGAESVTEIFQMVGLDGWITKVMSNDKTF